jgi:hypothetical protein
MLLDVEDAGVEECPDLGAREGDLVESKGGKRRRGKRTLPLEAFGRTDSHALPRMKAMIWRKSWET